MSPNCAPPAKPPISLRGCRRPSPRYLSVAVGTGQGRDLSRSNTTATASPSKDPNVSPASRTCHCVLTLNVLITLRYISISTFIQSDIQDGYQGHRTNYRTIWIRYNSHRIGCKAMSISQVHKVDRLSL